LKRWLENFLVARVWRRRVLCLLRRIEGRKRRKKM
jgi:hypothetical protein